MKNPIQHLFLLILLFLMNFSNVAFSNDDGGDAVYSNQGSADGYDGGALPPTVDPYSPPDSQMAQPYEIQNGNNFYQPNSDQDIPLENSYNPGASQFED